MASITPSDDPEPTSISRLVELGFHGILPL
jgi:hypothetical protein